MDHGASSSAVQQRQGPGGIRIDEIGEGPPIVFVHGGGLLGV